MVPVPMFNIVILFSITQIKVQSSNTLKIANIYQLFAWPVSYLWPLKTGMDPDHV